MSDIFIARESFSADVDGVPRSITAGVTRVREGHILLKQNPQYFERLDDSSVHFDVEEATKVPGSKRPAKSPKSDK